MPQKTVLAGQGLPGTVEFAYGGQINLDGPWLDDALHISANLHLDWIAIDFNWQSFYPTPNENPNLSRLNEALSFAAKNQISVLLKLSAPPAWALTANGPDPAQTVSLVSQILQNYPGLIQAIELFPEPNTMSGWGATPNPQAYADLYLKSQNALQGVSPHTLLIIGSLKPVSNLSNQEMDDQIFLQGLYDSGLKGQSKIIGLHINHAVGSPLDPPNAVLTARHFEEIHKVMIQNHENEAIIWITQIQPPVKLQADDQKEWLNQAYSLFKAQLYIGAVFFQSLNPDANGSTQTPLIADEQNYHPFYAPLRNLIAQNAPEKVLLNHGRPKDSLLAKLRK